MWISFHLLGFFIFTGLLKSYIHFNYFVLKIVLSKVLKYVLAFYFRDIFSGRQINCWGKYIDEVGKKFRHWNFIACSKVSIYGNSLNFMAISLPLLITVTSVEAVVLTTQFFENLLIFIWCFNLMKYLKN